MARNTKAADKLAMFMRECKAEKKRLKRPLTKEEILEIEKIG